MALPADLKTFRASDRYEQPQRIRKRELLLIAITLVLAFLRASESDYQEAKRQEVTAQEVERPFLLSHPLRPQDYACIRQQGTGKWTRERCARATK